MPTRQDTASPRSPDLFELLSARLWVARLGESDVNRWWRTDGVLGEDGAFVGPRVLPKTHGTARSRIAFAVARHACWERYPDRTASNLFSLDPETEDRLDAYLVERLDAFDWWEKTLGRLEKIGQGDDSAAVLLDAGVVTRADLTFVRDLGLGPDGRSLPIAAGRSPEETIRWLAAAFARSQPGELAVPYLVGEGGL